MVCRGYPIIIDTTPNHAKKVSAKKVSAKRDTDFEFWIGLVVENHLITPRMHASKLEIEHQRADSIVPFHLANLRAKALAG